MSEIFEETTEKVQRFGPVMTAALIGGAAAATAGAFWSARAIARRNGARSARDLNPVMRTAVTASELAHARDAVGDPIRSS